MCLNIIYFTIHSQPNLKLTFYRLISATLKEPITSDTYFFHQYMLKTWKLPTRVTVIVEHCLDHLYDYRLLRSIGNLLEQAAFSFNFIIYYTMNREYQRFIINLVSCMRLRNGSKIDTTHHISWQKREHIFYCLTWYYLSYDRNCLTTRKNSPQTSAQLRQSIEFLNQI